MNRKVSLMTLVIGILIFTASSFGMDKIIVLTDDRAPFEFKNAQGKIVGVAADTVTCALEKINVDYEMKILPWKRAQFLVKQGSADAFFAASKNASRDEYATLSTTVADQYWNWYLLKDNPLNPNDASFKSEGKSGSWLGSNSLRWLKKNGYTVKSQPKTINQLVKQLRIKRIDAIFGSNFVVEADLKKLGLLDKVKIVKGLHKPMGVYFSKKYLSANPGFLEKFNDAVAGCD